LEIREKTIQWLSMLLDEADCGNWILSLNTTTNSDYEQALFPCLMTRLLVGELRISLGQLLTTTTTTSTERMITNDIHALVRIITNDVLIDALTTTKAILHFQSTVQDALNSMVQFLLLSETKQSIKRVQCELCLLFGTILSQINFWDDTTTNDDNDSAVHVLKATVKGLDLINNNDIQSPHVIIASLSPAIIATLTISTTTEQRQLVQNHLMEPIRTAMNNTMSISLQQTNTTNEKVFQTISWCNLVVQAMAEFMWVEEMNSKLNNGLNCWIKEILSILNSTTTQKEEWARALDETMTSWNTLNNNDTTTQEEARQWLTHNDYTTTIKNR